MLLTKRRRKTRKNEKGTKSEEKSKSGERKLKIRKATYKRKLRKKHLGNNFSFILGRFFIFSSNFRERVEGLACVKYMIYRDKDQGENLEEHEEKLDAKG